jgi:hypothetical protein
MEPDPVMLPVDDRAAPSTIAGLFTVTVSRAQTLPFTVLLFPKVMVPAGT